MTPAELAGLVAIRTAYAEPITYTGAGLDAAPIPAIKSEVPADELMGYGGKGMRVSFEIEASLLPSAPRKTDTIAHAGTVWRLIDINPRPDIGAVVLFVERAP